MIRIALVAFALSTTLSASWVGQTSTKPSGRSSSRTSKTSSAPKRGTAAKPAEATLAPAPEPAPAPKDPAPLAADPPASTPATKDGATPAASSSASSSWSPLLLIGGLVAIGGLQWWMLRQLGRELREGIAEAKHAAEGAAASAAHAGRALAASERAYLVARSWSMRPPSSGEVPEVEFIVENVGRTPARKTLVRGQVEVRDTPLPAVPKWRGAETAGGTLTIPPGGRPASTLAGDKPITREEAERLRAGTSFLSIWGRVDYEDVLGSAQSVCFAWRYDMATGALTYDTASDAYHEIS